MIGFELPASTVEEALRVVRALGSHRYIAGQQLMAHALVLADAEDASEPSVWARTTLADPAIDAASRDERLMRACSTAELERLLSRYWSEGAGAARARDALKATLDRLELPIPEFELFDERHEDEIHPLLVDAGWELLQLAELDPERHKGAIGTFAEYIHFEVARFEEQESMPPMTHLYELGAIGPRELLEGARDGKLMQPLVLYTQGNESYVDYLVRGVLRAAKLA